MIFSQTLDATLSSDNGRLFGGCSWSPSFRSGMTSAIFQSDGKVEVPSEQLIISVLRDNTIMIGCEVGYSASELSMNCIDSKLACCLLNILRAFPHKRG